MRVYVYRGVGARLRRLGARRALDVALCDPDILRLTGRVRVVLSPRTSTAAEVAERRRGLERLSTGSSRLDELLGGGLEVGYITELVGEYGAGKTQLCHQLAVMAQLPPGEGGLGSRVLYIDTEGTFRPERIVSMAEYRGLDPREALENIVYVEAQSLDDLVEAVLSIGRLGVGLVVVDSIAYPFISPRSVGEARRSWGRLAALLKRLASWSGVAVVTNVERGGRAVGDPYTSMWVDVRVRLSPLGGGSVEALRLMPRSARACRLVIREEGVLDAQ